MQLGHGNSHNVLFDMEMCVHMCVYNSIALPELDVWLSLGPPAQKLHHWLD